MILMALIFSQLVVLLALLHLVRMSRYDQPSRIALRWRALIIKVKNWAWLTFTYDPLPCCWEDPLARRREMTAEQRKAEGLPGPVKGKWYQRPRYHIWA